MIRTFRDRDTESVFRRERVRRLGSAVQRAALRKLVVLHAATSLEDLRIPPANRLEKVRGKRDGQYSIRVNDQWRVCFEWRERGAWNVELTDYH